MSLDIAVLNKHGVPEYHISLDVSLHEKLMSAAEGNRLKTISRIHDYYEDTQFDASDMDTLVEEIEILISALHGDAQVIAILIRLRQLVERAKQEKKQIFVLSD